MLSRRTILALAALYQHGFSHRMSQYRGGPKFVFEDAELYDFLYERDFDHWFCQAARSQRYERQLQDYIMELGVLSDRIFSKVPDRGQRLQIASRILTRLAEAAILRGTNDYSPFAKLGEELRELQSLAEMDGYVLRDGALLPTERDVVNAMASQDALSELLRKAIKTPDVALHHLKLSEDHYIADRWDDCISNARKVVEEALKEMARELSTKMGTPLSRETLESPFKVRDFLERAGALEAEEKRAFAGAYGLLSHTGGHPYIARKDQARLLRHVALTYTQFAVLQFQGRMAQP